MRVLDGGLDHRNPTLGPELRGLRAFLIISKLEAIIEANSVNGSVASTA